MVEWVLGLLMLVAVVLLWASLSSQKEKIALLERELLRFNKAGAGLEHRIWSVEQWAGSVDERLAWLRAQIAKFEQAGAAIALPTPALEADRAEQLDAAPDAIAEEQSTDELAAANSAEPRAEPSGEPRAEPSGDATATEPSGAVERVAAERRLRRRTLQQVSAAQQPAEQPSAAASAHPYVDPSRAAGQAAQPQQAPTQGPAAQPYAGPQGQGQPPYGAQPAQPAAVNVGLEQWLGVRGAAALGALLLVLAVVYFFQYSIEHNLISPAMRVVIGTVVGVGCIAGAELRLRQRYEVLSNWLSGAGAAVLYLSFWASSALFHLVSPTVAGGLMVLVTGTCCVLTIKRGSMAIAALGLMGGFATPILLSTGSDRPLALFSYLLLLDAALLFVAHRRRWPLLALASLLGTAGYQMAWIGFRMGPERVGWGMLLTVVFALLYAAFSIRAATNEPAEPATPAAENERMAWRATEVVGVLVPFVFALYFSVQAEMLPSLPMLMGYLALLVVGATAVGVRANSEWLPAAASTSTLGVLAGWLLTHPVDGSTVAQLCAGTVLLAVGAHAPLEIERWHARQGLRISAPIWLLGGWALTLLTVLRTAEGSSSWVWLASWTLLSALAIRQAERSEQAWLHLVLPTAWTLGLVALAVLHLAGFGPHGPTWFAMLLVSVCALLQGGLLLTRATRSEASHAGSLATLLLLIPLLIAQPAPDVFAAATVLFAAMTAISCSRHGAGGWALIGAGVIAAVQASSWLSHLSVGDSGGLVPYASHGLAAVLLSAWPLLLKAEQRERLWPWRAAALVPWLFFLPMLALHERLYGLDVIAPLPLGLALVPLALLLTVRRFGPQTVDGNNSAVVWLAASAMSFITVAIPLQLDNEWITIGWALQGAALLLLWRRRDHAGLKWFALALLAAVTVRLVGNPWVLEYHPRSAMRVINWISYTYLLPVGCLLTGAWALSKLELARLRPEEESLTYGGEAIGWRALVVAALAVVFVWLNLTIIDWFAPGRMLELDLQRLPARDLAMSISWGVYALVVLAIGVWRKSGGLRKLSLVLVLATCAKVFLYDLSHLRELYRVMSLAGLAVSLIAISLAYQRFVFRKDEGDEKSDTNDKNKDRNEKVGS